MKDRSSCIVDGHNCSSEYDDEFMEGSDFLDLVGMTKQMENGHVDIYMMAQRLASLLGQTPDASDVETDRDVATRVEWSENDAHDHNLLVAGYTNCMDEAIRYLVEEEQYSCEHPVVQGLKHHLVSQQERVLLDAAARGTSPQTENTTKHNTTQTENNRLALLVDTLCTIRPPSI